MGRPRSESVYDEKFGNVARVLLTLYSHDMRGVKLSIAELQAASGVSKSVYYGHLYKNLLAAGLIREEKTPNKTYVHLTEKGKEFAKCLARVADILGLKGLLEQT